MFSNFMYIHICKCACGVKKNVEELKMYIFMCGVAYNVGYKICFCVFLFLSSEKEKKVRAIKPSTPEYSLPFTDNSIKTYNTQSTHPIILKLQLFA